MSAFKSHKRKSSINQSGSPNPKNVKIETPKNVNQQKGAATPGGKASNKKTPGQAATPKPNVQMFQGTAKLDFKTPNSEPGKKNAEPVSNEAKKNRHVRRRSQNKDKRRADRVKFGDLKKKAIEGDESARNELQQILAKFETDKSPLSKTKRRKCALLKRILNSEGGKNLAAVQSKKGAQGPKKGIVPNVPKKQHNGKVQAKQTVVVEKDDDDASDDEEDEDASEDDENENTSGDDENEEEETITEENEDDEDDDDDDDDDEEDEDDSEEDKSDEEEAVVVNKKPAGPKINQQVQDQNKQNKQSPASKAPGGAPTNKISRYVVFVGNIAFASTENDLREHFKKAGNIVDIRIPTNQDNKPRGFAYVELKDQAAYEKALSLHNTFLGGRKINVLYSEGGKKKSENQKGDMKAKNFKLQAMRKQGQLQGGFSNNQKRSARRDKNKQRGT